MNDATIEIGAATGEGSRAVAYAAVTMDTERVASVRLSLNVTVRPALRGRDVGYASLIAAAHEAFERGVRRATFRIEDAALGDDLREHRAVPNALALPYVTLRCLLNRFESTHVETTPSPGTRDLTARARAEVALALAA